MKLPTAHTAVFALATIFAASSATPSLARTRVTTHVQVTHHPDAYMPYGSDDSNIVNGHYAPGSTGYGRAAYNPEQPTDPDPRIGGAFKMQTDR